MTDKDEEIYNIFDTKKILKRPLHVSINNTSGLAGIAYWLNDYFELKDEHRIDKNHPIIAKIKEIVDKEFAEGRSSVFGDDEIVNIIRSIDKDFYKKLSVSEQ